MRKPFDGDIKITQNFNDPCCRESYAQFGLQGHNGIDYGCPTGTKILAPHEGKVIEATLDPQGYGLYLKIENTVEGSVLAHLKEFRVDVGDTISESQLIALSDNSGNSTGPHLHWGYYRFPRNRQNGFAGFIDQSPFINTNLPVSPELEQCKVQLAEETQKKQDNWNWGKELENELEGTKAEIQTHLNFQKQLAITLQVDQDTAKILGAITSLIAKEDQLNQTIKENDKLKSEQARLMQENGQFAQERDNALFQNKELSEALSKATFNTGEVQKKLDECNKIAKFDVIGKVFGLYICKLRK